MSNVPDQDNTAQQLPSELEQAILDGQAKQMAQSVPGTPALAIASFFDPQKGLTIGLIPRGQQSPEHLIAHVTYQNVSVAEADLRSCLTHASQTVNAVTAEQSFKNGYAAAMQEVDARLAAAHLEAKAASNQDVADNNSVTEDAKIYEAPANDHTSPDSATEAAPNDSHDVVDLSGDDGDDSDEFEPES